MTYSRFEDLPVRQEAIRLAENVYAMTVDRNLKGSCGCGTSWKRPGA
ncbi:MAG: hypothetical protein WCY54_08440 [Syntrophales bacterium]